MRLRATLSINFYCRETKAGKTGESPIELGVNISGSRFFVNLPRKCKPKDLPKQREYTSAVENRIRDYELWCLNRGKKITAEGVKEFIRNGFTIPVENLGFALDGFYKFVDEKDIKDTIKRKYRLVMNNFLAWSGLTVDSGLEDITPGKCKEFVEKTKKTYKNSTSSGMLHRFKSFLNYCVDNRLMEKNPFNGIKIKKEEVKIDTITPEEYRRIKELDLSWCERLQKIQALFVFACNTGLSYCDTQILMPEDFQTNEKGQVYIDKGRGKTGIQYTVVVLPDALDVAKKYGYKLPSISNQRLNCYLKELETLASVKTNITFHKARHYYARMLLNDFKFSLEVTARCLGHSTTRQSAHYAKLFSSTVFDAFSNI